MSICAIYYLLCNYRELFTILFAYTFVLFYTNLQTLRFLLLIIFFIITIIIVIYKKRKQEHIFFFVVCGEYEFPLIQNKQLKVTLFKYYNVITFVTSQVYLNKREKQRVLAVRKRIQLYRRNVLLLSENKYNCIIFFLIFQLKH